MTTTVGQTFPPYPSDSTRCDLECECIYECVYSGGGLGLVEGCHNEVWFGGTDVGIRRASAETWK